MKRKLLFLVTALVIAGAPGAALARHKRKHNAAPAHRSAPAATETSDEAPEAKTESAPEPAAAEPAREAEPTPAAEPPAEEDHPAGPPPQRRPSAAAKEPVADTGGPRLPPALQAGVLLGGLYRHLAWTQVTSGMLNGYSVSPGPEVGLRVEFYPAALVGRDFGANLGVLLSFNEGFGVHTAGSSGDISAIFQDFLVGLKVRFPLGIVIPHASVAYGGQVFKFSPDLAGVPSVFYAFVRLAAGVRLQLGDSLDLDLGAGYLPVINAGRQAGYVQSTEYFPSMSSYALEASGSLGVRVARLVGIRGGVEFRQFTLNTTNAGGTLMAQGGTDRFLTPWLMVEIVIDGAGPQGGGPED
jgi:hypothetical protein